MSQCLPYYVNASGLESDKIKKIDFSINSTSVT